MNETTYHVLIVEDDEKIRDGIEIYLKSLDKCDALCYYK